ncbi:glycyl radical protein [Desulfovibrio sp. OttesenSCG-928-C14]|nr:glycyl radical protein [Desulfovibrio sp. OttesenSCG-928-C14]
MSNPVCGFYETPQEHWIKSSEGSLHGHVRDKNPRVIDMLEAFDCTPPYIDIARARYFTESMRQTEGQHLTLRWAKALLHVAANIPIYIEDTQLIVGRLGTDKGRYGIVYPELDGDFYEGVLQDFAGREEPPIRIESDDIPILLNEIGIYWKGKTYHHALFRDMPEFCRKNAYSDPDGLVPRYIVSESSSLRSSLQWALDYDKILRRGFKGIREDARRRIEALDLENPEDLLRKKPFLEAVVITCDAVVLFARRHAALAREKALAETNPARRRELLEIAERCEWVPENPARTFHEAVQSHWLAQAFSRLEQRTGTIINNGRMDQQLIDFYRKDLREGVLDEVGALEILGCLWVQMAQFIELPLSPGVMDTQAGFAHWEAVTIGGQTREGFDATNELTYLLLRSKREFPTHYPDLAARVHTRSPERYLWDIAETIKQGQGYPKILNDEELIPRMLAKGAPLADAFDYIVSGCNETRMLNRESYMSPGTQVNLGAALELTLRNGRLKKFGDELFTFESGDPLAFGSWDDFWKAYLTQQNNLIKSSFMLQDTIHHTRAKCFASPLASGLHDLCLESCVDLNSDVKPDGALDIAFFDAIGFGTVVDSLSAIKTLVFEQKKISMAELLEALDRDFEGREDIQAMLQEAPAFGNGDPEVDGLGRALEASALEYTARYAGKNGVQPLEIRTTSVTANVPHGKFVGATPNGRKAWKPLSDGSSPSHGSDRNGPTAVLLSQYQSTNWNAPNRACRLLNMKMAPKTVEGEEGTKKLVDLIRAFIDLRVWHLQINIINRETLLAAQQDPHKYRSLVVRIAGYSAYFVDLSPDLQNDLIDRTEQVMA